VRSGALGILIVEGDEPISAALASALGKRGHRVTTARNVERALDLPTPDVFVCEARLPGACGFDLLSAITERGDRARSILLVSEPTVDDCLRALRLGAAAILTKPFRMAELVSAVESRTRVTPSESTPATPAPAVWDRSYVATLESADRCARELTAFGVLHDVPPSTRARIAGAVLEVVDNAARHARLGGTLIRVRGRILERWLHLEVRDEGTGFDSNAAREAMLPGPASSGLTRANALSDGFEIDSKPGRGTLVRLRFCVASACFDQGEMDLSEVDFLASTTVRSVMSALLEGETPDVTGISPAIAVVLGRLRAGPDPGEATPRPASRGTQLS
jgi:DNA-binding response OmpR family regulator